MGLSSVVKGAVGGFVGSGGNPLGAVMGGLSGMGSNAAASGIQSGMRMSRAEMEKAMEAIKAGSAGGRKELMGGAGRARDIYGSSYGDSLGAINQGYGQGFDYLNQAQGRLDPLAGMFDSSMGNQFSLQGIGQNLSDITSGDGPFAEMIAQNMLGSQGMLGGAGYARSGTAGAQGGQIGMQTALDINQMLFGQQMQNPALAAIQQQSALDMAGGQMAINQGGQLAGLHTGYGTQMGGLEQQLGSDLANIELGQGSNLANIRAGIGAQQASGAQALGEANASQYSPLIEMIGGQMGQGTGEGGTLDFLTNIFAQK
jgi:hypothetical protein